MRAICCAILAPLVLGAAAAEPDPRILRMQQWLMAVAHHEAGAIDDPLVQIAAWSNDELRALWLDSIAFRQLMREPRLAWFTRPGAGRRAPQPIRFTPRQLDDLRVTACAAAGIAATDRFCLQIKALARMDDDLRQLAQLAAAARGRGDPDYVLRRAVLLHTDIATSTVGGEPFAGAPPRDLFAPQRLKIDIADGRGANAQLGMLHWDIARALVDDLKAADRRTVLLWYRATAAWMQAQGHHDNNDHVDHGLQLFPDDSELLFLAACEHEALSRPAIQAVARAAVLPPGFELDVGSDDAELRAAENFFRRALSADSGHAEARLRLGRVLLARGRAREALEELRRANAAVDDPLLKYFAAMFLGAAEDALGHDAEADTAYRTAATIYPNAQSPHLAASALARRRGDRAAALASIERAFELAAAYPDGEDPWWSYPNTQGRDADARLDEVRELLIGRQP